MTFTSPLSLLWILLLLHRSEASHLWLQSEQMERTPVNIISNISRALLMAQPYSRDCHLQKTFGIKKACWLSYWSREN